MPPATSAPAVGSVLADRYVLVRHIARGGMGDVYEARDRLLERCVAVKVYRATAPADRRRFDAEVTTLAALNHPGLVHVFDAGEHADGGFLVLELVDGPNLRTILDRRGALHPEEVASLAAPVAAALAYVHEQGIVHRDVTPANVLCGADGRPRLADFGIARLLDATRMTAVTSAVGTAAYMAPEQVEGRDVTPAADVYALGLVLREALTGRPAFAGRGHEVALARLARDPDVEAGVPPEWRPLLRAMTARDPATRPTAAALVKQLERLAAGTGGDAPTAATAAIPVGVGGGGPGVDGGALTEALTVGDGTTVMPVAMLPSAGSEPAAPPAAPRRARRALWVALVSIALVLVVGLSSAGDGVELPPTTTSGPVAVTSPPTTAPTTAPPTTEARSRAGKGKGKGPAHDD